MTDGVQSEYRKIDRSVTMEAPDHVYEVQRRPSANGHADERH